jgi:hypothetical protein
VLDVLRKPTQDMAIVEAIHRALPGAGVYSKSA